MTNIRRFFNSKKSNNLKNQIGKIQYSEKDYLIKKNHFKIQKVFLNNFRNDFEVEYPKDLLTTNYSLIYRALLNEIENFFNNDICINYSIFKTMYLKIDDYEMTIRNHYADQLVCRIISCWDYIFQVLSKYLGTNLLSDYNTRDKIILQTSKELYFINDGGIMKALYRERSKEEVDLIISNIKSERKILKLDKKNKSIKKELKKSELSISNRLNILFSLYATDELQTLKGKIRNEITHKSSLTFKVFISVVDLFSDEGITVDRNGWFNIEELASLIDKNMEILKNGVQLLSEIIILDDYPTYTKFENELFNIFRFTCESCNATTDLTKDFYNELIKSSVEIKCYKCSGILNKYKEYQINQRDYMNVTYKNIVDFMK